jgi:hypothetical protein
MAVRAKATAAPQRALRVYFDEESMKSPLGSDGRCHCVSAGRNAGRASLVVATGDTLLFDRPYERLSAKSTRDDER